MAQKELVQIGGREWKRYSDPTMMLEPEESGRFDAEADDSVRPIIRYSEKAGTLDVELFYVMGEHHVIVVREAEGAVVGTDMKEAIRLHDYTDDEAMDEMMELMKNVDSFLGTEIHQTIHRFLQIRERLENVQEREPVKNHAAGEYTDEALENVEKAITDLREALDETQGEY